MDYSNLISAIVGAGVAGVCSFLILYFSLQAGKKSELLKCLVEQRICLLEFPDNHLENLGKLTHDQRVSVITAYLDYRSSLWIRERREKLEKAWREYKGNIDDYHPSFNRSKVTWHSLQSVDSKMTSIDWNESKERLDQFIAFLTKSPLEN